MPIIISLGINHFTATDGTIKCAIVERFNRTLRSRIYRYFYSKDTKLYGEDTYALFRQPVTKFPRLPVLVNDIDEQWQADLMDMSWVTRENDGFKYLLTIIDCLSRYAWAAPIKDKSSKSIIESFKNVFTKGKRVPKKIQTDQGKEFVNQFGQLQVV